MDESIAIPLALACVIGFGIGAQWLAWQFRLPSILLLLSAGVIAGPVLGVVDPQKLLGDLLFPFVAMCVGIILFEGALSLKLSDLRQIGRPLLLLLTVGVVVTWTLTSVAAYLLLDLSLFTCVLLGAILVVTGPTVIGPMLRQIRPTGRAGPIVRWEGIVIDPIGATLAVLVYEAHRVMQVGQVSLAHPGPLMTLLLTLLVGIVLGTAAAQLVALLLRGHMIPDHLDSPVTLMIVVVTFTISNMLQKESGLVTVTVMGVVLANANVSLRHVMEFKENLSILLISSLFILLAARLKFEAFVDLGWRGLAFVLVMILLVRPVSVLASLYWTNVEWRERLFIAWIAPRGIVAAAVSSVFALELETAGEGLVPATFLVIVGTVVIYGVTSPPLARLLGLSTVNPQGVLILGANRFARQLGRAIQQAGFPVLLVDTNHWNVSAARMDGLKTANVNILSELALERLDLGGIGRFLGMTGNDEVNSLGGLHLAELFGRSNVYQLTPFREAEGKRDVAAAHLRLRFLFSDKLTYAKLMESLDKGAVIKSTRLTEEFTYRDFRAQYGESAIPLCICQRQKLIICSPAEPIDPKPGATVIALVTQPVATASSEAAPADVSQDAAAGST